MKELKIIYGQEAVKKLYSDEELTSEELEENVKIFQFETENEKRAFIKGVEETIGWNEYCIPELEFGNY